MAAPSAPFESWSQADVATWLESQNLEECEPIFRLNHVDGKELSSLSEDILREIGLKSFGLRRKVMRALGVLLTAPTVAAELEAAPEDSHSTHVPIAYTLDVGQHQSVFTLLLKILPSADSAFSTQEKAHRITLQMKGKLAREAVISTGQNVCEIVLFSLCKVTLDSTSIGSAPGRIPISCGPFGDQRKWVKIWNRYAATGDCAMDCCFRPTYMVTAKVRDLTKAPPDIRRAELLRMELATLDCPNKAQRTHCVVAEPALEEAMALVRFNIDNCENVEFCRPKAR